MNTKTEDVVINGSHHDLDRLIKSLNEVRAKTNQEVTASVCGSFGYGYSIVCRWQRPMTEEELADIANRQEKAEEIAKNKRREEYLKLKEEFETE